MRRQQGRETPRISEETKEVIFYYSSGVKATYFDKAFNTVYMIPSESCWGEKYLKQLKPPGEGYAAVCKNVLKSSYDLC